MSDFHNIAKHSKARKDKWCVWCGENINRGDDQVSQSGRFDGQMYRSCYHPECWKALNTLEQWELEDGFLLYAFTRGCTCERGAKDCDRCNAASRGGENDG